jgi:formate transporter FocA
MATELSMDALLPGEMAAKAENIGVKKALTPWMTLFVLAMLAGAFVALGGVFATSTTAGFTQAGWPVGLQKLIGGFVFSLGLILIVIGGAELFTGNTLIIMAWAGRKVTTLLLLRNWSIVYAGNFVGSVLTALLVFWAKQYTFGSGQIGLQALSTANGKVSLEFGQAIALGILCNGLVCLAVWLTYSARTVTDKIMAIVFPITAFVAAGFEHCVANMYFLPLALMIKQGAPASFWESVGKTAADYPLITWQGFLFNNLLPVTIGNIIGGTLLVGVVYWFVYLRPAKAS